MTTAAAATTTVSTTNASGSQSAHRGSTPGVSPGGSAFPTAKRLYDVLTGLAPLSPELARRIHVCYPQIDLEWLMTGRIRGIELPATGQSDV